MRPPLRFGHIGVSDVVPLPGHLWPKAMELGLVRVDYPTQHIISPLISSTFGV